MSIEHFCVQNFTNITKIEHMYPSEALEERNSRRVYSDIISLSKY